MIIIPNLILARNDQANILQNRSQPSREFWQSFQREVPSLPKQSAIYIDSRQDGVSKPARDGAIGAGSISPTASWAVYYGLLWEDIFLAENFPELLNLVKTGKVERGNIYTFFYSRQGGLINTTDEVKKALFGAGSRVYIDSLDNINVPFHSPVLLEFSSDVNVDFSEVKYTTKQVNLLKYLSFLASRNHYYETVTVSSSTETKFAEVRNMIDRNSDTGWKGDNIFFTATKKEEIILDLGQVRNIGAVRIIPATLRRAQTKYSYECSLDGISWRKLGNFEKKIDKVLPFIDKFNQSDCAFIKLTIYDTPFHEAPQISEIEILESRFVDLDIDMAGEVEEDPFIFMSSADDRQILSEYFTNNGINGKICIFTDKYSPMQPLCKRYKFKLGEDSEGSLFIDQGGIVLQKLEFKVPTQVKLNIRNATIEYLPITQL